MTQFPSTRPGVPVRGPTLSFEVPTEGRYWLVAGIILWGTGLYKGINLITLLGTLLIVVWALHVLIVLRGARLCRKLRLRRRFAEPVFAQTPFTVETEIENPLKSKLLGLRLEDPGPERTRSWFLPRLSAGKKKRFLNEVVIPRRGWYTWQPLRVCTGYPLGLNERCVAFEARERVMVFPSLGQLHRGRLRRFLARAALTQGWARQRPSRQIMAQSEFHGLRDFRSGDSLRLIHWRTSARRGQLMVREFEDVPNENLILVLDPMLLPTREPKAHLEIDGQVAAGFGSAGGTDQLLEEAISLAATICWEWCRQKGDRFVLAIGGHAPVILEGITSREHALLMLECLALVLGNAAPDTGRLVDRLASANLPAGSVLVISPRPSNLGEILANRLHRRVAAIDLVTHPALDFFEKAIDHAA